MSAAEARAVDNLFWADAVSKWSTARVRHLVACLAQRFATGQFGEASERQRLRAVAEQDYAAYFEVRSKDYLVPLERFERHARYRRDGFFCRFQTPSKLLGGGARLPIF